MSQKLACRKSSSFVFTSSRGKAGSYQKQKSSLLVTAIGQIKRFISHPLASSIGSETSETTKKGHFQQILCRFSKDVYEFSFKTTMKVKKSDDFIIILYS